MKRLILLSAGLILATGLFAAKEWKEYYSNGQVKILYAYTDCHDVANGMHKQKVILKFENTGDKKVAISFERKTAYSNAKQGKDDVNTFKVEVAPGQTIEGTCETRDNALFIFSKHLDIAGSELKQFDLKNITIKNIE